MSHSLKEGAERRHSPALFTSKQNAAFQLSQVCAELLMTRDGICNSTGDGGRLL